jgi:hypothetical protein
LGGSKSASRLESAVDALCFGWVVGSWNEAHEIAPSFSANLDELRREFRAGISAALDPHWFRSARVSPPPRRAVEHIDHHFGHIRKKAPFHSHESTQLPPGDMGWRRTKRRRRFVVIPNVVHIFVSLCLQ